MNVLQYIFIFLFSSAVSLATLVVAMIKIDPTKASTASFLLFYLALFFFLSSIFTTISTAFRSQRRKRMNIENQMKISLRQSCILSLLIVLCAFLTSMQSLTWWIIILAIGFFAVIEYFALAGIEEEMEEN